MDFLDCRLYESGMRMSTTPKMVFIGGHTKSGTTFVGRALDLFDNVCVKGEMDYFRQFFAQLNGIANKYNSGNELINREVYDGQGTLVPIDENMMADIHRSIFTRLYCAGTEVPDDARFWVEKSPYNIYYTAAIRLIFPDAAIVCVYREPKAVFRSLVRHLADHRDAKHEDLHSQARKDTLDSFLKRWKNYIAHLEKFRERIILVQYQRVADDKQGFIDFARKSIFEENLGLCAPIETLSKENYLKSLPEEARAKSLVQIGPYKVELSDEELDTIEANCRPVKTTFDF